MSARAQIVADPFSAGERYRVIYADPPWHYRDEARAGKRGASYKYPLLSDDDIAQLPVAGIAAEHSALFLWVTWPKLLEALPIIEAWGFSYRTVAFVWVKRTRKSGALAWGMGSWSRANTEPCLLATRGKPKRASASVHQVVEAPLGRHSEKPDEVRERIVSLMGDVPRIELFARATAPGWVAWGNDVRAQPGPAAAARRPAPAQGDARARVLAYLRRRRRVTRSEVAVACGMTPAAASAALRSLVANGLARCHGRTRGRWYEPCRNP